MTTVAIIGVIAIILLVAYDGVHSGLYATVYSLVRNVLGFLLALTLCEPLVGLVTRFLSDRHPGPLYYKAISFAAVFGFVFLTGRWLKIRFTIPDVRSYPYADYIGGAALGVLNGIVLAGTALVLWSLMPFVKFLPGDFGRIGTEKLPLDAGSAMLRFYARSTRTMGAGRTFLLDDERVLRDEEEPYGVPDAVRDLDDDGQLDPVPGETFEDLNGNGRWDRGWLWRYRNHADFQAEDIRQAASPAAAPKGE